MSYRLMVHIALHKKSGHFYDVMNMNLITPPLKFPAPEVSIVAYSTFGYLLLLDHYLKKERL